MASDGSDCYFIAWGRIQDAVDPEPLEQLILGIADRFALPGQPVSATVCDRLGEAREAPFFYEALLAFGREPIPFGDDYQTWRADMDARMRQGQEIFYAGAVSDRDRGNAR